MALDSTKTTYIEIRGCHFYDDAVSPALGIPQHLLASILSIHDCTLEGFIGSRGAIAIWSGTDCWAHGNISTECITTPGTNVSWYNNIVDGILTA